MFPSANSSAERLYSFHATFIRWEGRFSWLVPRSFSHTLWTFCEILPWIFPFQGRLPRGFSFLLLPALLVFSPALQWSFLFPRASYKVLHFHLQGFGSFQVDDRYWYCWSVHIASFRWVWDIAMCYRYNIACWCVRLGSVCEASVYHSSYFRCNRDLPVNIIGCNLLYAFGKVTVWTLYLLLKVINHLQLQKKNKQGLIKISVFWFMTWAYN